MMHFQKALVLVLCAAAVSCSPVASTDETRKADVNGAAIEYVVSGPTDGEPLLFLHGGGLAETFAPIAVHPALAAYRLSRARRRDPPLSSASDIVGGEPTNRQENINTRL